MRAVPALALLLLLLLPVDPARAASACGGLVRDDADLLDAGEEAEVIAAAEALVDQAVRPLVVVTDTLGGRDSEDVLVDLVTGCPGLTTGDGEWGSNVLGVIVAVDDRETGVYEGGGLPELDVSRTDVDVDVMNPMFADGELAGGLVAGLEAMTDIRADAVAAAEAAGSGDPSDGDGAGGGLWFLGGAGAVGLVGAGGTALVRRRQQARAVADAHAAAVSAQAGLAQQVIDLERDLEVASIAARSLAERLGLAEATTVRERIAATRSSVDATLTRWYALTARIDPTPTADVATYQSIEQALRAMTGQLEEAGGAASALSGHVAEVEALEEGFAGRMSAVATAQGTTRAAMAEAQRRGYRTDPAEEDLRLSVDAVARAEAAMAERLILAADEHLDLAEVAVADAQGWVEGIEVMRAGMAEDTEALRERRQQLLDRVEPALATMEELEQRWATSAWEDVAGNGSEAEAELASAAAALERTAHAQLLDVQDWDGADEALDVAEQDLQDAAALLDAIAERRRRIVEAADLLGPTLESAVAVVEEARGYIAGHAADIDDALEVQVADLAATIDRADEVAHGMQRGDRVDPIAAGAAAAQAQQELTDALATARGQVTAADRARRQATRAQSQARRDLADARTFARGRGRYLSRRHRATMAQLEDRMERLDALADPLERQREAAAISAAAAEVRREIRAAVRRQRERDRRRTSASSGGGWSWGTGSGGSSGGGGFGGGFGTGGSGRSSSSRSRSSGSSRSRSSGSSARRSSSGRSRSGRSSRW